MKNLYQLSYPWLKTNDVHLISCCICSGQNKQEPISQFILNEKTFTIMRCVADELMYLSPQPGKEYCDSLYNHPSYFEGTDDMYGLSMDEQKATEIAKIRINELRQYAPKATSILEIGCAHGHLLDEVRRQGFSVVKGIEFSKGAVKIGQGKNLDVKQQDINNLSADDSDEKFDVVASYSVLEHLNNPCEFLSKVKKILKPDGILIIRVPDTDSMEGPKLSLLDHFWHFTRASIQRIMEKNGFKIKSIFPSGVFYGTQHSGELKNMTIVATL